MKYDYRWLVIVFGNVILMLLCQLLNSGLTNLSLYLFLGALFVITPMFFLNFFQGFLCVLLTGLLLDASSPVVFGLHTFLFGATYATLYFLVENYHLSLTQNRSLIIQITNIVLYLAMGIILGGSHMLKLWYWGVLFYNIAVSSFVLFVVGAWFLSLQESIYNWASKEKSVLHD
ncbi:MAG: hypothetical protein COZ46_04685 [Verrucomicrobia bacterium CG_4_10_14_3_um_filter_43_23]|nr:MAG: hypothetical protein AUJ82_07235 [Verrucomicrobia bacterium CG1_02_43_26]PIP58566.1 MAG: hypothetical protein COX01_08010 [Verrucomicrobia bacterium CG22_combo_CG10-13_8_21_14_all_43_17]PIX58283.1 MAG: hypothetical protein COZ46_04685 [Verrucomicrobia bacterium CG_4_10_14_3_um_filter_43_23]PIY60793.1 MAG: hypothetical protein COY94_08600 [Verrucomicrobia bacterium CG_4_10_14_0_8_um_filter_43_34]PJA44280.1 MAG: hypothetical protein CO175_03715 [Verrucomicrobia bacterium CG_4_9_14_3_um_fi